MTRARWLAFVLVAAALAPGVAKADQSMDLTLSDLTNRQPLAVPPNACPGNTMQEKQACDAYNVQLSQLELSWKELMSQLAATITPPVLEPARTVGPGGFYVGVDSWVTGIDHGQGYWSQGTQGDNRFDVNNRFVKSTYTWFRLNVRKGLPYGFELGASAGHALHTDYFVWGLSVKWALFEGFRTGIGYLPDIAVRAAVETMTGPTHFNLTTPSLDLLISKPIVIAKTAKLTPYLAGQAWWVIADSEVVDLTPGTSAYDTCNPYSPSDSVTMNQNNPSGKNTTFVCTPQPGAPPNYGFDFENNYVFSQIRAFRTRLVVGLQFQYLALTLSGSFGFDLLPPGKLDKSLVTYQQVNPSTPGSLTTVKDTNLLPRQWTAAFGVGFTY